MNQNFVHFSTLQSLSVEKIQKYAKPIAEPKENFEQKFTYSRKCAMRFNLFSRPFSVKIEKGLAGVNNRFEDDPY